MRFCQNVLSKRNSPCHRNRPSPRSTSGAALKLAALPALSGALLSRYCPGGDPTASDPLPSWNDGPAKQAILDFVRATTDPASKDFVPPQDRIAEFDQDGTLWVEHPVYTQIVFCLDRVGDLVEAKPQLKNRQPFKTVLSGDREAIAKLSMREFFEIVLATQSGMDVEAFREDVRKWLAAAKASALGPPLHRTGVSAHDRGAELPARQRLQDVHRHRRQRGLRARIFRERFTASRPSRSPAPSRRSNTATTRTTGRSSPGSPSWCSITSKPERSRILVDVSGGVLTRPSATPPPTTSRCWST